MNSLCAAPLMLALLAACEQAPRAVAGEDAGTASVKEDGGSDSASAFSVLPDTIDAVPLTAAMLDGVLPPTWHVGESWEIMFCAASKESTRKGEYDTTRVIFRVVSPPRPGAFTAVVTAQERIVSSRLWVRRPQEYDGVKLYPPGGFDYVAPWPAREMIFDGRTFDPVPRMIRDQGGVHAAYDRINETWSTEGILAFTPRVPGGLRNPEISEAALRADRRRNTIRPTPDGLIFELQYGDPFIERCVVFWRRGESWWSFARADGLDVDAGANLETTFETSENSGRLWAVKLPPGQPDSLNCNSKH